MHIVKVEMNQKVKSTVEALEFIAYLISTLNNSWRLMDTGH